MPWFVFGIRLPPFIYKHKITHAQRCNLEFVLYEFHRIFLTFACFLNSWTPQIQINKLKKTWKKTKWKKNFFGKLQRRIVDLCAVYSISVSAKCWHCTHIRNEHETRHIFFVGVDVTLLHDDGYYTKCEEREKWTKFDWDTFPQMSKCRLIWMFFKWRRGFTSIVRMLNKCSFCWI